MAHPGTWSWAGMIAASGLGVFLLIDSAGPAASAEPKDCVRLEPGVSAMVYEGRYDILCVHPPPGPLRITCGAAGVRGPSFLAVHPHRVEGADAGRLAITYGARFEIIGEVPADGAEDARVFFSYDGPFNHIFDRYTLTCRW